MQVAGQVRAERQLNGQWAVHRFALGQGVPREAQLAQALHIGPGLHGKQGSVETGGVRGADAEHALAAAELLHPDAIAAQVAVAGVTQAAGVRVNHAKDGQPSILLADDATADRLGEAVELDVGDAGVAESAGRQRRQRDRLARLAQTQQTQPVSSSPRAAARCEA